MDGRRVRVDRLRLHRRADAVRLAEPQFVVRHRRSVRFPEGPVLPVPEPVAPRADGPPAAALELARGVHAARRFPSGATRTRSRSSCCSTARRSACATGRASRSCISRGRFRTNRERCRAVARRGGKIVATDEVQTTGAPARIELAVDRAAVRGGRTGPGVHHGAHRGRKGTAVQERRRPPAPFPSRRPRHDCGRRQRRPDESRAVQGPDASKPPPTRRSTACVWPWSRPGGPPG